MNISKNTRAAIALTAVAVSAVLMIIGFIVLPNTLVVQLTAGGEVGNTMSKLFGLLIPFALTVIFSFLFYLNSVDSRVPNDVGMLAGAAVGIVVMICIFCFNL